MIRLQRSMITGLRQEAVAPGSVCTALQQAIELEHATIPVYLYALYSLDADRNGEVAAILESVVIEEMLHMTLAANVLNALGGAPQIDRAGFIPTYPGPLPGGVQSDLTVNLAPFSATQLATFLQIEEPEDPLTIKAAAVAADTITIGEFYTAISDAIAALGNGAFVDPPRNQVGPALMRESVVVVDVPTAQLAIQTIIEQGEGTSTSPEEVVGDGFAHYYRFMQIQKGHLLVPAPGNTPPWAYAGAPVAVDPAGIYDLPVNPALTPYPPGTAQAFANDNFNYTYTSLLFALHRLFNGDASRAQFNRALGLMMSLKGQAKAMAAGIPNPGVVTGPTFEYLAVNPGVAAS
jgi:rubrerythrin